MSKTENRSSFAGRVDYEITAKTDSGPLTGIADCTVVPARHRKRGLAEAQNFGTVMADCKFAAAGPRNPLRTSLFLEKLRPRIPDCKTQQRWRIVAVKSKNSPSELTRTLFWIFSSGPRCSSPVNRAQSRKFSSS